MRGNYQPLYDALVSCSVGQNTGIKFASYAWLVLLHTRHCFIWESKALSIGSPIIGHVSISTYCNNNTFYDCNIVSTGHSSNYQAGSLKKICSGNIPN